MGRGELQAACLKTPTSALPLSSPPTGRAWDGGDLQQSGFGALLLARSAVTSPWELGTRVVGNSGVAKARDSRCDDHGGDGQQLITPLPHSGLHPFTA